MVKQINSEVENTLIYEIDDFISQYEIEAIGAGIDSKLKKFEKINLMIYVEAKSENLASFFKEFQLGIKYWNKINKIAYIAHKRHWKAIVELDDIFTKFKEKYFDIDNLEQAWKWLND